MNLFKHSCEFEIIFLKEIHPLSSSFNTNNTIYMISTSSRPSPSVTAEDHSNLPSCPFCDDEEILKTAIGFTPFHLIHSVELVLPIEC